MWESLISRLAKGDFIDALSQGSRHQGSQRLTVSGAETNGLAISLSRGAEVAGPGLPI
jgi:hypothetical protein